MPAKRGFCTAWSIKHSPVKCDLRPAKPSSHIQHKKSTCYNIRCEFTQQKTLEFKNPPTPRASCSDSSGEAGASLPESLCFHVNPRTNRSKSSDAGTLCSYSLSLHCGFFFITNSVYLLQVFTRTVVLKARRSPFPTVLCIIWTCMHPWVTTSVPVLKTTRFPYSDRRCCHIRVFHPYLTARSPRLIILWRGPRGGFGHALPTLHGHVVLEWQDFDEPLVTLRDSRLRYFLQYLIYYSFVYSH